jgi:hypothetical protein
MNASTNSSSYVGKLFPILLIIIGLIALYYLYKYLFASQAVSSYTLLGKTTAANPTQKIAVQSDDLAPLYEGGEFTISTWIYINNWSHRNGRPKSILNIGGRNFDTIRIYLGNFKPTLNVRLHTSNQLNNTGARANSQNALFRATTSQPDQPAQLCDLPEIELQRWVNITVAVNGKTVDVYLDGKLTRSCVLPDLFKVDGSGYSANLVDFDGFGGLISTTTMYDAALSPDVVYKLYMGGPEPITSIGQWFSSFFG